MVMKLSERFIVLLCLSIAVFFLYGCPKKTVRPSADSLMTLEAVGVLEEVRDAFINKKESVLERDMTPMLSSETVRELVFDSATISYEYKLITIKDDKITIMLTWQGSYTKESETRNNGGTSFFTLQGAPLKVVQIEGENPLSIPR
jgi:hypothetical protein